MVFEKDTCKDVAVLVFDTTARNAVIAGFRSGFWDNLLDMRARWIKDPGHLWDEADPEKLKNNIPHIVKSPKTCKGCELWGENHPLNKNGYCGECEAEYEENIEKREYWMDRLPGTRG